jgi:hypothetical protein
MLAVLGIATTAARLFATSAAILLVASSLPAQSPQTEFFETRIRPILAAKCHVCHGQQQQMAGLNLATAAGFRKGAESGPILGAGEVDGSRLLQAVSYQGRVKMPPTGKLPEGEIAALREWARMGAPWPGESPAKPAVQRDPWFLRPLRNGPPPNVRDTSWARNTIDRFILAKLEENRLAPAPPAEKLTLLRRATYDLTGLPPTEAEIRQFMNDKSMDAFARVVERLLNSPRYGERWGRHWLDVARYADSTGADEDHRYPHAWRYRDYVIEAFQSDLPYNQFVLEQVAGDLLPPSEPGQVNVKGVIATGFLALGPKLIAEQDKIKMFYDIVDEQIDVTSRAFLGLTLACARCHDHKFDPVSTKDYYGLASIFASTKQLSKLEGTVSKLYFAPLVPREEAGRYEAHQTRIEEKQKQIDELLAEEGRRYRDLLAPRLADYMLAAREVYASGADPAVVAGTGGLDATVLARWAEYLKPTKERRAHLEPWYQAQPLALSKTAADYQNRFLHTAAVRREANAKWKQQAAEARAAGKAPPEPPKFQPGEDRFYTEVTTGKGPFALPEKNRAEVLSESARSRLAAFQKELKALKDSGPAEPPLACAVGEGEAVEQRVFIRGNPQNQGEVVPKRFPLVLAGVNQTPITRGSGRLELARWLADAANPLTARVMVNRIWQWHFGEGIVRTPSNFGHLGELPTHPELLDYLAGEFVRQGWSVKAMHRLIMLSNTYQMSSLATPEQRERDSENRLFSRFLRRRLTVEEIRDTLLVLDGSLDIAMGGTLQKGQGTDKEFSDDRKSLNPQQSKRRTIYLPLRRSNLPSFFTLFDFGDATTPGEGRSQTNIAPQALYMMNSEFVESRSRALAAQLLDDDRLDDSRRIERIYLTTIGRPPEQQETRAALDYISGFPGAGQGDDRKLLAWTSFCRTMAASNDFMYVY